MTEKFYSDEKTILTELNTRKILIPEIEKYWEERGNPMPSGILGKNNFAFLSRHVATARNESFSFYKKALDLGLIPFWAEYKEDIFVSKSKPKTNLVIPRNSEGARFRFSCAHSQEKKLISELVCKKGYSILEFHNYLWEQNFTKGEKLDFSSWLKNFGKKEDYYFADISMNIAHGVLFKDFHDKSNLLKSSNSNILVEVFEEAFEKCEEVFGFKPLVYKFSYEENFERFPEIEKNYNNFLKLKTMEKNSKNKQVKKSEETQKNIPHGLTKKQDYIDKNGFQKFKY